MSEAEKAASAVFGVTVVSGRTQNQPSASISKVLEIVVEDLPVVRRRCAHAIGGAHNPPVENDFVSRRWLCIEPMGDAFPLCAVGRVFGVAVQIVDPHLRVR